MAFVALSSFLLGGVVFLFEHLFYAKGSFNPISFLSDGASSEESQLILLSSIYSSNFVFCASLLFPLTTIVLFGSEPTN